LDPYNPSEAKSSIQQVRRDSRERPFPNLKKMIMAKLVTSTICTSGGDLKYSSAPYRIGSTRFGLGYFETLLLNDVGRE
jgi:hypothetical protein